MLFGRFGVWEVLTFFALLFFLFGARRIPALGRGFGEGIANLRRALRGTPSVAESNEEADRPKRLSE
jgi:Sec-independent protein translocase protein TatA